VAGGGVEVLLSDLEVVVKSSGAIVVDVNDTRDWGGTFNDFVMYL